MKEALNQEVVGSNPTRPTNDFKSLDTIWLVASKVSLLFFCYSCF